MATAVDPVTGADMDAQFDNAFTDGVLYLDVNTHKVEQYVGNYFNVVEEIAARVERERAQNARAELEIRKKREQAEVFAHKGGKLRSVAKRMREAAEEAEESMVDERREDKTIRDFKIPCQEFHYDFNGKILDIKQVGIIKEGEPAVKRYLNFLSSGSSKYSIDLLKDAGVDLTTPAPIQEAFDTFAGYFDQFEALS